MTPAKIKNNLILLFTGLFLYLLIALYSRNIAKQDEKEFYEASISGKLEKIELGDHGFATVIKVVGEKNSYVFYITPPFGSASIYDKAVVGDSIHKPSKTGTLFVKKQNGKLLKCTFKKPE